jgi:PadR family transcriptional regulator PadR
MSTVDDPSERLEFLQGTLEVLILRSLQAGPNHAYGISQFLERQSGNEFLAANGSLYPALQDTVAARLAYGPMEDVPRRAPAPVLPAHAGRAAATDCARSKWERFVEAWRGSWRRRVRDEH